MERLRNNEGSLPPDSAPRGVFTRYGTVFLLALIALLMLSDFILRGIAPAFEPAKTDFSELYTSAWLWRHGQNPYDPQLGTAAQEQLVGVSVLIAPIYPLTTLALVSPFTFLPWGWANLLWLVLGLGGIAATVVLLLRLHSSRTSRFRALAFTTFILSFDPLHQAFHLGNIALLVVPLSFYAISLAEQGYDGWAGVLFGIAAALKPQLGIWPLLYYLFRGRKRVFFGAVAVGASAAAILLLRPIPFFNAMASYRANLHHWFAPDSLYGFTETALAFRVNTTQVVFYRLCHNVRASILLAHTLFLIGLAIWMGILWRARFRVPPPLAISSLLALSFISLYHSVSDATILTLALCWAVPAEDQPWTRARIFAGVLFLLLMLPGHSALMRLSPDLGASLTTSRWWSLFVARYFVWLLVALNAALLAGLRESARRIRQREQF
jgi:Glycosyltransferase family 87